MPRPGYFKIKAKAADFVLKVYLGSRTVFEDQRLRSPNPILTILDPTNPILNSSGGSTCHTFLCILLMHYELLLVVTINVKVKYKKA